MSVHGTADVTLDITRTSQSITTGRAIVSQGASQRNAALVLVRAYVTP